MDIGIGYTGYDNFFFLDKNWINRLIYILSQSNLVCEDKTKRKMTVKTIFMKNFN